jgi:hypothetical protein
MWNVLNPEAHWMSDMNWRVFSPLLECPRTIVTQAPIPANESLIEPGVTSGPSQMSLCPVKNQHGSQKRSQECQNIEMSHKK